MRTRMVSTALIVMIFAAAPALALGPVDVEIGVTYWVSDTELNFEGVEEFDSEDLNFYGRIWVGKWGGKVEFQKTDPEFDGGMSPAKQDLGVDLNYTYFDIRRKLISPTDNNYLAVGLGYQKVELDIDFGDDVDSTGWRLVAEGRVSLIGIVYGYAEIAWYVDMDDIDEAEIDGYDYELGVGVKPFPFMRFYAGYRLNTLDAEFEEDFKATVTETFEPSGFFIGAAVNF